MKICHYSVISSLITMLKLFVRLTFALQGASASWKILITAMALISIKFPNSGIYKSVHDPLSSILPQFLQEKRNIFEQKLYSEGTALIAPFFCRKADTPQILIKLLNQYLILSHWNGSNMSLTSLSLEERARNEHSSLVKAVENLT